MSDDHVLMAKVADLYHLRGLTQQEIADRLGLSRPAVSRLLARARAEGIVKVEIAFPEAGHRALERELEEQFGLREAIVVAGRSESPAATRRVVGQAAARYLGRRLHGGERIGISWGTTVQAAVEHMSRRALRVTVVPLVGGVGQVTPGIHANELASRLADRLDGRVHLLHAPAVVAQRDVRDALLSDPEIRKALDLARRSDVALVGLGALIASSTLVRTGYFTADDLKTLRRKGGVGDVCTRSFTRDGQPADGALDRRILAVELEDLRRIPTVIAAAGGMEKAEAIAGALRGRLASVLVTDHLAARAVLQTTREWAETPS
jgi:DNA-binding transcriptional regulator LsrR (DeoR family)